MKDNFKTQLLFIFVKLGNLTSLSEAQYRGLQGVSPL